MISKVKLAKKAFRNKSLLRKLPDLFRAYRAIFRGQYKPGFKGVFLPILILIYVFSPIDFIPDFIPFVGFIDDFIVFSFAIPMLMRQVEKFIIWEENQKKLQNNELEAK